MTDDQNYDELKKQGSENVSKGVFISKPLKRENSFSWSWTGTATAISDAAPEIQTTKGVSWLSQISFSFFSPLMEKGWKQKSLTEYDVPLYSPYSDNYETDFIEFRENFTKFCEMKDKNGDPVSPSKAMRSAIWEQYKGDIKIGWVMFFFQRLGTYARPFLIGRLASFFASDDDPAALGYALANGFACASVFEMIFTLQVFFYGIRICVSLQQVLSRLIFNKTLSLAPEKQEGAESSGKIINLMSVDAESIARYFIIAVQGFGAVIDIFIATTLLCINVGIEGLVVLVVIILVFIFLKNFGSVITSWQKKALESKDLRAKYIGEVLHGIKLFKLYAWEEVLETRVLGARAKEVSITKGYYFRMFTIFAVNQSADVLFFLAIFGIYYARGKEIKIDTIFIAIGLIGILKSALFFTGWVLQLIFPLLVSIGRVSKFLTAKELEEYVEQVEEEDVVFEFENATLSWHDDKPQIEEARKDKGEGKDDADPKGGDAGVIDGFLLSHINLKIKRNQLTAIVGPVASGKSSLLNAVVGEMYLKDGKVRKNMQEDETLDLLAQSHYILNATVRENIVMGQKLDENRYVQSLRNAALIADINNSFPQQDKTEIGERGVTLSGGQKSRVALARALYRECDIYLMDDILSAVDPDVGDEIFERAILGQMMDTTRVIVMNSHLHNLAKCDHIIVIDEGKIQGEGTYDELVEKFAGLMRPRTGAEERAGHEQKATTERVVIKKASKTEELVGKETKEEGFVKGEVFWYFFRNMLNCCGTKGVMLLIFLISFVTNFLKLTPSTWLAIWASASDGGGSLFGDHPDSWYFTIWIGLNVSAIITYVCSLFFNISLVLTSSEKIHNDAWSGLLSARLVYFDTNLIGRIMNRFTADVANNDNQLVFQTNQVTGLGCLILIYLIFQIVAIPYIFIILIPMAYMFYRLSNYYIVTSRDLQRLKSISFSPIIAHFEECVNSMQIIRVCNYSDANKQKNSTLVSTFGRIYFSLLVSERWFAFRIALLSASIIFIMANMCVLLKSSFLNNAAILGLALTYIDACANMLQFTMRQLIQWMNSMVGVERLMDTRDAEPKEDPRILPIDPDPKSWPKEGNLEFKDVRFKYREELPEILKGLSFSVHGGEMIGVCGRTGSGKSTILLALYRMYSHTTGTILIDGVDIKDLGLKCLRSALSIIPQDPVILSGTLKYNLDPLDLCSEEKLFEVIKKMELDSHFHIEAEEKGINKLLSYEIKEKGENLSAGQKQLICIARVLLQDRKIVLLDEATANIDAETDAKIQKVLREFFKGKTVLTIAHRIDTIMDSDRVLLLNQGTVLEFGNPRELLKNPASEWSKFVKGDRKSSEEVEQSNV